MIDEPLTIVSREWRANTTCGPHSKREAVRSKIKSAPQPQTKQLTTTQNIAWHPLHHVIFPHHSMVSMELTPGSEYDGEDERGQRQWLFQRTTPSCHTNYTVFTVRSVECVPTPILFSPVCSDDQCSFEWNEVGSLAIARSPHSPFLLFRSLFLLLPSIPFILFTPQ